MPAKHQLAIKTISHPYGSLPAHRLGMPLSFVCSWCWESSCVNGVLVCRCTSADFLLGSRPIQHNLQQLLGPQFAPMGRILHSSKFQQECCLGRTAFCMSSTFHATGAGPGFGKAVGQEANPGCTLLPGSVPATNKHGQTAHSQLKVPKAGKNPFPFSSKAFPSLAAAVWWKLQRLELLFSTYNPHFHSWCLLWFVPSNQLWSQQP